ncbi:hypothetical protein K501DRAFT_285162 [Backusella circina FSU 941]|nr:hypothetical protein K501DRAFT_285162 [Backusella circina FSU 941]
MQKNALLLCSLAIIVLALKADAIEPVNNIVCGRAVCPSGWVSSDANATPTCPSDCPSSCKIMDDVCCPGRKYGVCSSTISTAAGSGGETTETASSGAKPTTSGGTVASGPSSALMSPTAVSSIASSLASGTSTSAAAAASSAAAPAAASAGSLIQPSYMVGFITIMFCILKSF